jgi:hypothetical protein|tara:strand:- start:1438 stop:1947 length:510 start_codon:yes stop_codon:yes gene_type:complete
MILGKSKTIFLILIMILLSSKSISEDKIISTPLINLEELKPSFEEIVNEDFKEIEINETNARNLDIIKKDLFFLELIGLDKITAKTELIKIKVGETKKFEMLEVKALKCALDKSSNKTDYVAYIQVRDTAGSQNEKIFIFNGWTFSANPSLTPVEHAIYDLWLVGCKSS